MRAVDGTRQITTSATLPGSSDPTSSSRPSARAALIVTPDSTSSGDIRRFTQANDIASGRLGVGEVPGLKSVPIATGTPASMNARAGAWWSFMRNQVVTGSSVATTGSPSSAAAAIAAIPPGDGDAR